MSNQKRDYYQVLGITKQSTPEEIKKAYRKMAMQYHPDTNKASDAEKKFKEIQEAYEVLSDPNKKQMYDQYGHQGVNQQAGGFGGNPFGGFGGFGGFSGSFNGEDISDMFGGDINDILRGFGFGGFGNPRGPRKGQNIMTSVKISFKNAYNGTTLNVKINNETHKVDVPAGVRTGNNLKIKEKGQPGANGGPRGDVFVKIIVEEHPFFEREDDDIYLTLPISFTKLITGTDLSFDLLGQKISFSVPEMTDHRKLIRLKEKGFPSLGTGRRGDLYIKLEPTLPKKLSKKAWKDLEHIASELEDDELEDTIRKINQS